MNFQSAYQILSNMHEQEIETVPGTYYYYSYKLSGFHDGYKNNVIFELGTKEKQGKRLLYKNFDPRG